LLPPGGIF